MSSMASQIGWFASGSLATWLLRGAPSEMVLEFRRHTGTCGDGLFHCQWNLHAITATTILFIISKGVVSVLASRRSKPTSKINFYSYFATRRSQVRSICFYFIFHLGVSASYILRRYVCICDDIYNCG